MDERGEIRRNLVNPPVKDTVVVPTSGLTVVRFLADNPGFWLVHCHMSMHNHIGMAFVIKVTTMHHSTMNLNLCRCCFLGWRCPTFSSSAR